MTLSTGLFFGTVDSGYNLGFFEDVLEIISNSNRPLIIFPQATRVDVLDRSYHNHEVKLLHFQ